MASERKASSSVELRKMLSEVEVDVVGVARLADWTRTKLEDTALRLLPEARSVVVFAMEIYSEVLDLTTGERVTGAASMNDLLERHQEYFAGRLTKAAYDISKASRKLGFKALPLPGQGCPRDARFFEAVFSYKHAAQAAALGKIGWHSLVISPRFGPRVQFSCCLTEAELKPTDILPVALKCGSCHICLDNCPARALTEPDDGAAYSINKFACGSFRSAAGGCSECMRLCPMGRKSKRL
jgi:epoxyqueuosine reductase QueG